MFNLIVFIGANTIYTILTTLKSLLLIKNDNKHLNAIAHSITYGYYAIIIKLTSDNNYLTGIIGCAISNYIGTYIAMVINNTLSKNNTMCYKISINSNHNIIQDDLESRLVNRDYNKVIKKGNDGDDVCYSIYCKKCKMGFLDEFLRRWDGNIKYHIEKY